MWESSSTSPVSASTIHEFRGFSFLVFLHCSVPWFLVVCCLDYFSNLIGFIFVCKLSKDLQKRKHRHTEVFFFRNFWWLSIVWRIIFKLLSTEFRAPSHPVHGMASIIFPGSSPSAPSHVLFIVATCSLVLWSLHCGEHIRVPEGDVPWFNEEKAQKLCIWDPSLPYRSLHLVGPPDPS